MYQILVKDMLAIVRMSCDSCFFCSWMGYSRSKGQLIGKQISGCPITSVFFLGGSLVSFFGGSLLSFFLVSLLSFSLFGSNSLEREVPW